MFDVSLIELAVIALVALLVLGPERLPRAARTVGLYVRKARQSWYSVRADIERELAADELKRSIKRSGDDLRESIGFDRLRDDLSGRKPAPAKPAVTAETPTATGSTSAPAADANVASVEVPSESTAPSIDVLPEALDGDAAPVAPSPSDPARPSGDLPPRP